ncbi:alpha/beta hydrolase [Phenylobacterium sp.]|uniref:alpha/beta hydrolase n=1 Tax=Phenylobacterium sp. TaxID=1871053 RepID=UPI0027310474|nr:alpha/beta hydrolase [Phenylobacterium sp.]MDP1872775.1 alpha/beta hydrolase [Phenylobacterium sp.]MDP3490336.1 alpha/beta hydrolase [Phenylobacterium sp.]
MDRASNRKLVDPELLALLDSFPAFDLTEEILPLMRGRPARFQTRPEDQARTSLERRTIPGPDGAPEVGVLVYRPADAKGDLPCILHIHGGGYVAGAAADNEAVHRPLAADLACCIVSVEYRLAPETPFPGPVEDCYAALAWVFANAKALGVDPGRIGLMGESAGGGLAAGLALLARDRGEYHLAFQHLIYPMIDDRTCATADPHPYAGAFVWTPQANAFGWRSLLGHEPGADGVSPYAAAARAQDVSGLPPTYIATGALDLFLEEDLAFAQRLLRAGVPVELHVYPGAFHGFQWAPEAKVSQIAARDSRAALARAMA